MTRSEKCRLSIDKTLDERQKNYGDFEGHAAITQNIKWIMIHSLRWDKLTYSQKESLEMIAHKIGRILNGNPNHKDSWRDIAGYAVLIEETLSDEQT